MQCPTTLLLALDTAFDKRSWHGANLMGSVRGVAPGDAARAVGRRRTIWEQVLHAAYWKHRVLTRLAGKAKFPRPGSNWPRMPGERADAAWRADLDLLRATHAALRSHVASLAAIDDRTAWLIQGAAAHDLYHAGQIKLLRRMLGDVSGRSRRLPATR